MNEDLVLKTPTPSTDGVGGINLKKDIKFVNILPE